MVSISRISASEVPQARQLHNRFTAQDVPLETIAEWYDDVISIVTESL